VMINARMLLTRILTGRSFVLPKNWLEATLLGSSTFVMGS